MAGRRQATLFLYPMVGGMHLGAWREPAAPLDPALDRAVFERLVRTAERGKLHGFFLADTLALWDRMSLPALSRTARAVTFEPLTLMAALAPLTRRIGLLCTASTTYNAPLDVARQFASLDHLSGGRAGWNVVTSGTPNEAGNFGRARHMDHALRYARAQRFFDDVTGLWDGWDQPRPVIAQAGSSPVGRAFAARVADVVYTLQGALPDARAFYADIKRLVADAGRAPEHVKVLPALLLVVAPTQAEADERLERLDALVAPRVGLAQLETLLETSLAGHSLDDPLPDVAETELGVKGRQRWFLELAHREGLTIGQAMRRAARLGTVAGTPEAIADRIEEWIEADAADGFNLTFGDAGPSLELFVDRVVPELQRRGLFHADYAGATLHESIGIPAHAPGTARDARRH